MQARDGAGVRRGDVLASFNGMPSSTDGEPTRMLSSGEIEALVENHVLLARMAVDNGMDGVELLRFLAEVNIWAPVLIISGFDRRVLESAFRLGEALGLAMIGPLEKPVRFQDLERVLKELRASFVE